MQKYPDSPEEWNDPKFTLFREFNFRSTPDLEILIRLVKENMYDGGNSGYTRARLLGILRSYHERANRRFWIKHYHPKTWWYRYHVSTLQRKLRRRFYTKTYRGELMLCLIANEVIKEENNGLSERTKTDCKSSK